MLFSTGGPYDTLGLEAGEDTWSSSFFICASRFTSSSSLCIKEEMSKPRNGRGDSLVCGGRGEVVVGVMVVGLLLGAS